MPLPMTPSLATRKRTRSTNINEANNDHHATNVSITSAATRTSVSTATTSTLPRSATAGPINGPPKRQRNNPPIPPPVLPRTNYPLRNRSLTPDPRQSSTRFPSLQTPSASLINRPRYNLRPRRPQSQVRLPQVPTPHPIVAPRRIRRPPPSAAPTGLTSSSTSSINTFQPPPSATNFSPPLPAPPTPVPMTSVISPLSFSIPPVIQPRQYRLVYISDDDDDTPANRQGTATVVNTTFNIVTDDDDEEFIRPQTIRRSTSRSISGGGFQPRIRSIMNPSSATSTSSSSSSASSNSSGSMTTINTQDFINGVAHIRLNRAIEIVIDSIQSLEGAANNVDQLVFALIYGRLGTRTEFETIEGMIRLSRILNLNMPARLSQDEIDSLPKITFDMKSITTSSALLVEKCPICLTEFTDQETINRLHCTHLFHLQCISTWLSENDSCPTCRRKVMGD